jgi:hypothetical protein
MKKKGLSYHVAVVFANSGETPTQNLRWRQISNLNYTPTRFICPRAISASETNVYESLLSPKSKIDNLYQVIISPDDLKNIIANKTRPQIDGAIFYNDVFSSDEAAVHETRFCFHIYHNPQISGGTGLDFSPCPDHTNCADEGCKQKREPTRLNACTEPLSP